jgi:hypothetical protein
LAGRAESQFFLDEPSRVEKVSLASRAGLIKFRLVHTTGTYPHVLQFTYPVDSVFRAFDPNITFHNDFARRKHGVMGKEGSWAVGTCPPASQPPLGVADADVLKRRVNN